MNEDLKHQDRPPRRDVERWVAAAAAVACFAAGLRRRTPAGFWLAITGGALTWWAAGLDGRGVRRAALHYSAASPARVSADPQTDRGRVVPTNPLPPPEPRT